MSEQNKKHQNPEKTKRPAPTPEQMKAFRSAYSTLSQKACENGNRVQFSIGKDGTKIAYSKNETGDNDANFVPNATGGTVITDSPLGEVYGWAYGHDEQFVYETGLLGSFTISTTKDGTEQDLYEFYPDGNIEKLHFVLGSGGPEDHTDDKVTHIAWLSPEETTQLALTIEDAHLEYRDPPVEN